MKLDGEEKAILESVERGEWRSAKGVKHARSRYAGYAKATFARTVALTSAFRAKTSKRSKSGRSRRAFLTKP